MAGSHIAGPTANRLVMLATGQGLQQRWFEFGQAHTARICVRRRM